MKPAFFLAFAFAFVPAFVTTQAQEACVQVIQPAVSPSGVCQEFANPCVVPEDWKSVPSCSVVGTDTNTGKSLERKMDSRIEKMRAYWDRKKAEQGANKEMSTNRNFSRIGSGSLTRSNRDERLPTNTNSNRDGIRTFTEKNFQSDVAERYSLRGGFERPGEATAADRRERRASRAPIMSRSDVRRTGDLKSTVKWDVLSRQFTTRKSYGPNPFTVRSQYLKDQKAARDASNQEIDVEARMRSGQRVYRGQRMSGQLTSDDLADLRENRTSE